MQYKIDNVEVFVEKQEYVNAMFLGWQIYQE